MEKFNENYQICAKFLEVKTDEARKLLKKIMEETKKPASNQ